MSKPDFLSSDDIREIIRERQLSNEWYVLTGYSINFTHAITEIEEIYYKPNTDANADYELYFDIYTPFTTAMFKKIRITEKQLREIISKYHLRSAIEKVEQVK